MTAAIASPTPSENLSEEQTGVAKTRVKWYRVPVKREVLSQLNKRSDLLALAQTLGFLAVVLGGAALCVYSAVHGPWYLTAILVFLNGHTWQFLINGFHELIHESVFRTRFLNKVFLNILSFLGWYNHHWFWASHTEHHKFTLHPPDDLEVVLPYSFDLKGLWKWGIVNWRGPYGQIRNTIRSARGLIAPNDKWTNALFPADNKHKRWLLQRWAIIVLVGQGLIAATFIALAILVHPGYLVGILAVNFPTMFGSWLHQLCNSAQHIGLKDNVPDFRLCCRTIYLNPFVQFLYWHMNYHIEHHMYAAVPCYRLGALHRAIKHELAPCPRGLYQTWKQIAEIQARQKADPNYQYEQPVPTPARRAGEKLG